MSVWLDVKNWNHWSIVIRLTYGRSYYKMVSFFSWFVWYMSLTKELRVIDITNPGNLGIPEFVYWHTMKDCHKRLTRHISDSEMRFGGCWAYTNNQPDNRRDRENLNGNPDFGGFEHPPVEGQDGKLRKTQRQGIGQFNVKENKAWSDQY